MRYILSLFISITTPLYAADTLYCPGNHQYIQVGMTMAQVITACGTPMQKKISQTPFQHAVPVLQLIYNNVGAPEAFYGVWSLPTGNNTGVSLKIDVIDNKVYSIHINGDPSRAFSVCNDTHIEKGDDVSKVYVTCGTPSIVNNTYITATVPDAGYPEIWIYQFNDQPEIRLTFAKGVLESIQ